MLLCTARQLSGIVRDFFSVCYMFKFDYFSKIFLLLKFHVQNSFIQLISALQQVLRSAQTDFMLAKVKVKLCTIVQFPIKLSAPRL